MLLLGKKILKVFVTLPFNKRIENINYLGLKILTTDYSGALGANLMQKKLNRSSDLTESNGKC